MGGYTGCMSDKRKLTDTLLGGQLDDLILTGRRDGKSWELIAREIWLRTERAISITGQTVANWAADLKEPA